MKVSERVRTASIGKLSWTLETERGRAAVADPLVSGRTSRHRYLSAEGTLDWDLGRDHLVGHIAAELDKRPDLVASGDRAFAKTRSLAAGIGWSHDGHWRLDLTMRQTSAQAKSPVARLVDLASGASRAERQVQAELSLATLAMGGTKVLTIGAQASAGHLIGFDQELTGSGRRDDGAGVFARLTF